MQPVLVKVYGYLKPAGPALLDELRAGCGSFGPELAEAFSLDGRLLLISYEGAFFPLEEVLEVLSAFQAGAKAAGIALEGRLDHLDLEAWNLTRYEFSPSGRKSTNRCLNQILDFSGH